MKNRIKNSVILIILTLFLLMIEFVPVTCVLQRVTGISCPSCGMTRAFYSILGFDFVQAFHYNILSIPLFIFIVFSIIVLLYEIFVGKWNYIPTLLKILSKKSVIVLIAILLCVSTIVNNLP